MYLISAVLMFVRGGIDALMLRTQLTIQITNSWKQTTIIRVFLRRNYDYIYGYAIYLWFMECCYSITTGACLLPSL